MIMSEDFSFSDLLKAAESAGGAFEPLPNGEYEVIVETANATKTGTGKSKIVARYKVVGGPHNNRTVFNDHVLTPANANAMIIFFRQMSALGLKSDYFSQNPSLEKVAADMAGKRVRLRLGTREWQSVKRNSVLAILPSTGTPGAVAGLPPAPSFSGLGASAPPVIPNIPADPPFTTPSPEAMAIISEPDDEAPDTATPVVTPPPSLPF
jgi:hypothetical protein